MSLGSEKKTSPRHSGHLRLRTFLKVQQTDANADTLRALHWEVWDATHPQCSLLPSSGKPSLGAEEIQGPGAAVGPWHMIPASNSVCSFLFIALHMERMVAANNLAAFSNLILDHCINKPRTYRLHAGIGCPRGLRFSRLAASASHLHGQWHSDPGMPSGVPLPLPNHAQMPRLLRAPRAWPSNGGR